LQIASGRDPWLVRTPIDKPPLFLYTIAGSLRLLGATETAARLPSLLATALTIWLTFGLGRKLYNEAVGLLAAWLAALSPFTILFAPTAFTDPMLVALVLAGCLAAAHARPGWAGLFLGLAIAAKQQGVFFAPLAMALLVSCITCHVSRVTCHVLRSFLLAIIVVLLPIFIWDLAREQSSEFWRLSLVNYGGLGITTANFGERWWAFIGLLKYGAASPFLNSIFVAGLPLLLTYGVWHNNQSRIRRFSVKFEHASLPNPADDQILSSARLSGKTSGRSLLSCASAQATQTDRIFSLFTLAFLAGHAWLSFQVWDRYLLGLIPILALLLARILLLPWSILTSYWLNHRPKLRPIARLVAGLGLVYLLAATLAGPAQDAANARYPLGSNSSALSGLEQITAYLQGHAGANTTLYHRWLGTHWRFYLWGYPYDLQYWQSPQDLATRARPGHLIAFPSWHSDTQARLALAAAGLSLQELTRAYTPAGYPSIVLYQIVEKEVRSRE